MKEAKTLIANSSDVISLVNAVGSVIYATTSTADLFGYTPQELVGRSTFKLIHPRDRDLSKRALEEVLENPAVPRQIVIRLRRKSGGWRCVESTISSLADERNGSVLVVICRNLSTRRTLSGPERTDEPLRANVELEEFAYAVAHDLREPLRTISMFTTLLAKNSMLNSDGNELAVSIVEAVKRMSDIFDGLHAFAVLGAEDPPQDLDLAALVAEVLKNLGHAIATSKATVIVESLPRVKTNGRHLGRVLQNLIANAIKYRKEQVPVEIRITAEAVGHDWLIKVQDNGIGIHPEHHERVFRIFKRLHGPETPGAGIGLAICKKLVERMGGSIWVESQEGAGSTFCFTIDNGFEVARRLRPVGDSTAAWAAGSHLDEGSVASGMMQSARMRGAKGA